MRLMYNKSRKRTKSHFDTGYMVRIPVLCHTVSFNFKGQPLMFLDSQSRFFEMKFLWQICLFCLICLIRQICLMLSNFKLSSFLFNYNFIFHFILINLNLSFGIVKTLFLVSNLNIRHFSKIRQICQAS